MADKKRYYPREIADDLPDDVLPADYFIIPCDDEHGHSVRMQFRSSPELNIQCDEIIASHRFPFRVKGDLFRFAVFDTCRRLLRHTHDIPDILARLEITHVIMRRKQRSAAFEKSIQELQLTIDDMYRSGAENEIVDVLNEIGAQVSQMIEIDSYWGNRYKAEVERRWGPLRRELEAKLSKNRCPVEWGFRRDRNRNGEEE